MKVLYLTKAVPGPNAREAGYKLSYNLLSHFLSSHEVTLCTCVNAPHEDSMLEELKARPVTVASFRIPGHRKLINAVRHPQFPFVLSVRYDEQIRTWLRTYCAEWRPDVVFVDFTQMAAYIADIRQAAPQAVTLLYEHDVSAQMAERRVLGAGGPKRWFWQREQRLLTRLEPAHCNMFDLVCTPSEKDLQELLRLGVGQDRVLKLSLFAGFHVSEGWESPPTNAVPTLFYLGALNRAENADAVRRLVREVLPVVRTRFGDARALIAGGGGEALQAELGAEPGVTFAGFVPDLIPAARQAHVAVFPLAMGAGVKIKVLEAMSWGMPVVTTPVGAEGIPGRHGTHFLVSDSTEGLIEQVCSVVADPDRSKALGQAGQGMCLEAFDFRSEVKRLDQRVADFFAKRNRVGV